MVSNDIGHPADVIASQAIERLEDLISVMERAADQVARGCVLEEIEVEDYDLYIAEDFEQAIICVSCADDYFDLLEAVADDTGISLDDTEEIAIHMPEAEFEECMVTGGFTAWKGFSVEKKNDILVEILDCICQRLQERGLTVNCSDEEHVIFRLPIRGRS
jgi:hypothetical protein